MKANPTQGRTILARNLQSAIDEAGLTFRELSDRSSVSQSMISYLLKGSVACGIDTLYRLATALGISMEDLVRQDAADWKANQDTEFMSLYRPFSVASPEIRLAVRRILGV